MLNKREVQVKNLKKVFSFSFNNTQNQAIPKFGLSGVETLQPLPTPTPLTPTKQPSKTTEI